MGCKCSAEDHLSEVASLNGQIENNSKRDEMEKDINNIPNPFKKKKNKDSDANTISNRDQEYIDAYVDKLVEKMIETEDEEFTDCFYKFSNKEYADLEETVNNKVINGTIAANKLESDNNIEEVYDILNAYKVAQDEAYRFFSFGDAMLIK